MKSGIEMITACVKVTTDFQQNLATVFSFFVVNNVDIFQLLSRNRHIDWIKYSDPFLPGVVFTTPNSVGNPSKKIFDFDDEKNRTIQKLLSPVLTPSLLDKAG